MNCLESSVSILEHVDAMYQEFNEGGDEPSSLLSEGGTVDDYQLQ